MEDEYDFVIFGTGLVETLLATYLSEKKKRVLVVDKNKTYGNEIRTFNYNDLVEYFNKEPLECLKSKSREFNIDIIPKIMIINGGIQDFISKYNLKDLVNFVLVPGSYIFKENRCHSIPISETNSLSSKLIPFFQKPKLIRFFLSIRKYVKNPEGYKFKSTMAEEFEYYGIDSTVQELIGHAIALNLDNEYLKRSPKETYDKILLYLSSIMKYRNEVSPYVFPLYGLSELAQAFSRISSSLGAHYRLNTQVNKIEEEAGIFTLSLLDQENNKVNIIANSLIGDPSYFQDDSYIKYEVIRGIYIIEGDVLLLRNTPSAQITFLSSELKRKNDIFLLCLGKREKVCPEGYKVAIISTIKETDNPEKELLPISSKLGNIVQEFISVSKIKGAKTKKDKIYIADSIDHTPSLESVFEQMGNIMVAIEEDELLL